MDQQSAWDDITAAIANAPYPVRILPTDPTDAQTCLEELGISTHSWLGAVVANAGALIVDHGWLRVLGCGAAGLPDVVAASDRQAGRLIVGFDVLGGQFAWISPQPGSSPTVHYFGPDDLEWLDLEQGYADWLHAMLSGSMTRFYETLRWPGWELEVSATAPDQGITTYPPPWSADGNDLATASRQLAPLTELVAYNEETARQVLNNGALRSTTFATTALRHGSRITEITSDAQE